MSKLSAIQAWGLGLGPSSHVKAKWPVSVTPALGRQRFVDYWGFLVHQSSHNSGSEYSERYHSPDRQGVTEEGTWC